MRVVITLAVGLFAFLAPAWADDSWSGTWDTRWRGGGARLILEQRGNKIEGTYPLYAGTVAGTIDGHEFNGRWMEGARSGGFVFALASDGKSFMGRYDSGEWWTGVRLAGERAAGLTVDQSTPRNAFRTFVIAGNLARRGALDELGKALEVVEFSADDMRLLIGPKLDRARDLFAAMDQTTFRVWSVPEGAADGTDVTLTLTQSGSDATLTLVLRRGSDGKWRIAMPSAELLASDMRRLLGRHGGKAPPPDDHLKLRNPRATLRTFLEGMNTWDAGGGRAQATSALDLSFVSEAVRPHEGGLAAEYLKQVLERVSFFLLQEVPDDGASREPYVLFEHPAGKVILAPMGEGAEARWTFTADTVRNIRPLYAALENMPAVTDEILPGRPSPSSFFIVRRHIGALWPALLRPFGAIELWQALGIVLLAVLGSLVGWLVAAILIALVGRRVLAWLRLPAGAPEATAFAWPLRLLATALFWFLGSRVLGLPDIVQHVLHAAIALLVAIGGTWLGLLIITIVGAVYQRRAERTVTNFDDMVVAFATGAAKIGLVVLGAITIADALNIPYQGVIAGLGIGGLAVAFASRETLSNIFGAGILLADRPFRRGDWIGTPDNTQGTVEQVGIRSTRIRTPYDTLVVVPNGKLVDATINNFGARRERLLRCTLAVSYDTRPEQLEAFVAALAELPRAHPALVAGRTQAGVWQLTERAIEIEFVGYVTAASMADERTARQAALLDIVRLAEKHGVKFAAMESAADDLAEALGARPAKSEAAG